jgi:hypothetical protein
LTIDIITAGMRNTLATNAGLFTGIARGVDHQIDAV